MKASLVASFVPVSSDGQQASPQNPDGHYLLNWAFGRWTYAGAPTGSFMTSAPRSEEDTQASEGRTILRMTVITAQGESGAWRRKLESAKFGKNGSAGDPLILAVAKIG